MAKDKRKTLRQLTELKKLYPAPRHYLEFDNPFQLLVTTILSAQCTDEKVNAVAPALFKKYPGPEDFAAEAIERIEEAVRPTGFYRNKAKAIKGASEMIVREYGGEVPGSMEELVKLPGVARKSANAILQHGFSTVIGIVVDTHVVRVSKRLGWTWEKDPVKIERDLMALFDKSEWKWIPFYLKNHGRTVCKARAPKCADCEISTICPSASLEPPKTKKRTK